jgi:tetratricopeptide (TPR) repeat protein
MKRFVRICLALILTALYGYTDNLINDAAAYYNNGVEYSNKGDYDQAIADYEAALRIDPNHTSAKYYLEDARRARGY